MAACAPVCLWKARRTAANNKTRRGSRPAAFPIGLYVFSNSSSAWTVSTSYSWAAYFGAIFLQQDCVQALGAGSLIQTYMMTIPYCVYPIVALLIVFLFCMGWFPKLGGMKTAYQRVAETGKTYSDASRKYNLASEYGEEEGNNVWYFILPLAILVGIAVVTGDLVVAAVIAILVCMVMYIAGKIMTFSEFWDTFVKGFSDMLPIIILLIAALTFQKIASEMQMTEFFVDVCKPIMSGTLFPMITFIIVGLLAFMIANAWGVCTLVAPVLLPLGASVGANIVLVMAAILSGWRCHSSTSCSPRSRRKRG